MNTNTLPIDRNRIKWILLNRVKQIILPIPVIKTQVIRT